MTPVVFALIIANVVAYGIEMLIGQSILANFALYPIGQFQYDDYVVGFHPWQLITYGFLHDPKNLAHIILNLYAVYAFGSSIEQALGSRRFAWLYFASVLTGGICQLIVMTITVNGGGDPGSAVGASGGVFGILLAFGMLFPKRRVMLIIPPIPMPAWVLVTLYGLLELGSGVFGWQAGVAHFAHLGGMLGAFVALVVFHYQSCRRN
jgi:membrane associated rhomboid family serine protease